MNWKSVTILVIAALQTTTGCQFYPSGEYLRFVRVPENLEVGEEVLQVQVHPRRNFHILPIDKEEDVNYFTYRDFNRTTVSVLLARPLEDLVDTENPQNVLKFKLICDYDDGEDTISSSLSVTVYVEDVNDHTPIFVGAPYHVTVDELTPVGLTIFRGIRAIDHDKPNTPNSDVQYAITGGNERGKFTLDSSHRAYMVLQKNLDYDAGDREFVLTVTASDRGIPPRVSTAAVKLTVLDSDDLSPKFTKGVYRIKIPETFPIKGEKIHQRLDFDPPIYAFDQDLGVDTAVRYDIIAGNERQLFYLDYINGSMFLEREIDLDLERSLPGNTFVLQIQASQVDNPAKMGVARVEVEVTDLNDNLPEFEVDFYNISIVENLPNGFSVLQIIATDQDQGDYGEFVYYLDDKSSAFALDPNTGWLTVKNQTILDREKTSTIAMKVYAKEKKANVISHQIESSSVNIEVTLLDANDNNPTYVPINTYEFTTSVNTKVGDVIGQVRAVDPDLDRNGLVAYSIQKSANDSVPFEINSKTGQIYVKDVLEFEEKLTLFVEAFDQPLNPSEKRSSLAVVTVDVQDPKDDNKTLPKFVGAPYEFWIGNNAQVGTSVGQIRISNNGDRDNMVFDLLHSYHEGVPFAVEERSGTVTVIEKLDNYDRSIYDFEAVVTNEKDISVITNVTIYVVNIQEESNTLTTNNGTSPIEFHVKENQPSVLIGQLINEDVPHPKLKFVIANQRDVKNRINISADGALYTLTPLDREERDSYTLTVICEHVDTRASSARIYQVTIYVWDENDNPPQFEQISYIGKIMENSIAGSEVKLDYQIRASDVDLGVNSQFTISLRGEGSEIFRLDRNSGKLYFNGAESPLDRERTPIYNLKVIAVDNGGLQSEVPLTIMVEDENDNAPEFTGISILYKQGVEVLEADKSWITSNQNEGLSTISRLQIRLPGKVVAKISPLISLSENIPIGTAVLKLLAEDNDLDDGPKFEMMSETYIPSATHVSDPYYVTQYFSINSNSGEIAIARTLPSESEFRLNVTATDKGDLKDSITIRISVKDVNDHPPVFKKSWYNFDIEETAKTIRGFGKVEATDSDFGPNANITYAIRDNQMIPFTISQNSGILSVTEELDREQNDKYSFIIVAYDNPINESRLNSTVTVEVNVLDVNDNAPVFYGYDDITYETDNLPAIPVYYATVAENSPVGTPITRVYANDSDFIGNGNGLVLFNIPHNKNNDNLFTIDSKDGIITTMSKFNYDVEKSYNVTIVASDLGSPSLSSVALLMVDVTDVPVDMENIEQPIFTHRYYEVEVEENVPVPVKLLTLNVTDMYRRHRLRYSIAAEKNSAVKRMFKIDSRNGTIYIISSPDREQLDRYELKVRLDEYKVGRDMTVMVYPVTNERLGSLGLNEAKVVIRITDVNDNVPKFTITGRPIITAIPTNVNYGYHIVKLKAEDPDLDINGQVRYQILGRSDEESRRFSVDPITGQVRAIASFARDAGKVYGFDVKATDRKGADDGKSSIANVFVYVLDENKQLVLVMGSKPSDIERDMGSIVTVLQNSTGLDVRVRKLSPHVNNNQVDNTITDMYVYAVDPLLNVIVDMDNLQKLIRNKRSEIEKKLNSYKLIDVMSGSFEPWQTRSQKIFLSSLEIGVLILGCLVFLGALVTAVCVICIRQKKKRMLQKSYIHAQPVGYAIATNMFGKPTLYPPTYGEGLPFTDHGYEVQPALTGYPHQRDSTLKYNGRRPSMRERPRSLAGLETSITSLHSSGHDSGIVDGTLHYYYEQSTGHSSDTTNSSYEDSLNSMNEHRKPGTTIRKQSENIQLRRNRSDAQQSLSLHRIPHTHLNPAPTVLISASSGTR